MQETVQQKNFSDKIVNGTGHTALLARAGTGKTSTIIATVLKYMDKYKGAEITICAYNKSIADEMKTKLLKQRENIPWRTLGIHTMHSLGFGMLRYKYQPEVRNDKVAVLFQELIEPNIKEEEKKLLATARSLVSHAKVSGFGLAGCGDISSVRDWFTLEDHYDISDLEQVEIARAIEFAQYIYKKSLQQTNVIDFDDMILMPLIQNLTTKFKKDLIFLDEAQDLSPTRQMLMEKFIKPGSGRFAIVGDDRQAIYGFTGADDNAMANMIERYEAEVLPLTVSWRCSKRVIEEAQDLVPDIEYAPNAEDGEVYEAEEVPESIQVTDAILCRNTAPLIQQAYTIMRKGIKCRVEGRAIGANLLKLTNKWHVTEINTFMERLELHVAQKRDEFKNKKHKMQELEDRVKALQYISQYCATRGLTRMQELRAEINSLFSDDVKNVVTLCTYHRSKGREWDNVYLLEHEKLCPSKHARKDWQLLQEDNLAYVAITRARKTVTFISKPDDN